MRYRVQIVSSGHNFEIEPDEAILEAALRQGFGFPYGCRDGRCGSCRGRVLEGIIYYPEQRPSGLSEKEEKQGYALFCQARAGSSLVIEVREVEPSAQTTAKKIPCRVARMERLAPDVMRLFLKLPNQQRLPFKAGQYLEFLLRDGRRRAFSLANAPHNDEFLELHIRHVPNGRFTGFVFNEMQEKAILRIEGPLGSFYLREESSRPILLMGGGTGFAPLKGIIEHCLAQSSPRPMHLYWGARTQSDLYLSNLPQQWVQNIPHFQYTPVLSDVSEKTTWNGRQGWVHEVLAMDYPDLSGYEVYMSGPPPMIDAAKERFAQNKLAEASLYFDSFEFSVDV